MLSETEKRPFIDEAKRLRALHMKVPYPIPDLSINNLLRSIQTINIVLVVNRSQSEVVQCWPVRTLVLFLFLSLLPSLLNPYFPHTFLVSNLSLHPWDPRYPIILPYSFQSIRLSGPIIVLFQFLPSPFICFIFSIYNDDGCICPTGGCTLSGGLIVISGRSCSSVAPSNQWIMNRCLQYLHHHWLHLHHWEQLKCRMSEYLFSFSSLDSLAHSMDRSSFNSFSLCVHTRITSCSIRELLSLFFFLFHFLISSCSDGLFLHLFVSLYIE